MFVRAQLIAVISSNANHQCAHSTTLLCFLAYLTTSRSVYAHLGLLPFHWLPCDAYPYGTLLPPLANVLDQLGNQLLPREFGNKPFAVTLLPSEFSTRQAR